MLDEPEQQEQTDTFTNAEQQAFSAKHRALRGSDRLKYPPRGGRCKSECGIPDHDSFYLTNLGRNRKQQKQEHRCFLAIGHRGCCEFSSECGRADVLGATNIL